MTDTLATVAPPTKAVPRMRELQRLETRGAIMASAIELFAQRGFDGAALTEIALRSNVRVPLIIYHFGSKEALWREAVGEIYRRVTDHMDSYQAQIAEASGREFYRLCATAQITALARYPEYMRILFQEGTQKSDRLEWLIINYQNKITDMIVEIIKRAQSEGIVPIVDPLHAKFVLSGAFCLPIVLAPEYAFLTGEDSQSDAFIARHIDFCLDLILRPTSGPS
jgi:TetR/AcrR family transcriptional regulator